MFTRFHRRLPFINFCISSTGLAFQVFILSPSHKQINDELKVFNTANNKK